MDRIEIQRAKRFRGEFTPPPDKSISHRAVMFSCLAEGKSIVRNFLRAADTESTMRAFQRLGTIIEDHGDTLVINGTGLRGLSEPSDVIDCGNSGTTMRLLSGILAGAPFFSVLTGDDSLRTRPMARIITPLRLMGASISARDGDRYPPLAIRGGQLKPVSYNMPVASAQVKSALILAGLCADGTTSVIEPGKSRDHTERMLPAFGAALTVDGLTVSVTGGHALHPCDTDVPADFSSAAFFIVAAILISGSELLVRNVCLNPTRTGLLGLLQTMGADISVSNMRTVSGEEVGDITCRGNNRLKAADVTADLIPSLIDEFPILCIAAASAEGVTTISGAGELRVKESDRIAAMAAGLKRMGVDAEERPDGISIHGTGALRGAEVESFGDHRIAMAMAVAGLIAEGTTVIRGASAIGISFPKFFDQLSRLTA